MPVSTRQREAGTGSPQRGQGSFAAFGGAESGGRTVLQKGHSEGSGECAMVDSVAAL